MGFIQAAVRRNKSEMVAHIARVNSTVRRGAKGAFEAAGIHWSSHRIHGPYRNHVSGEKNLVLSFGSESLSRVQSSPSR